jgi:hypothetical protein
MRGNDASRQQYETRAVATCSSLYQKRYLVSPVSVSRVYHAFDLNHRVQRPNLLLALQADQWIQQGSHSRQRPFAKSMSRAAKFHEQESHKAQAAREA